jgi:tol-pal system-associated acyl-CoA thioesterase
MKTPITSPIEEDYIYRVRVYYEDTDAAGVVYHTNYLKWMERARTEWLHSQELSCTALHREGYALAVYHAEITYHQPARLEEVLSVSCNLVEVGACRFKMIQRIERYNRLLAEGVITLACLDASTFKPTRLPKQVKHLFEQYLPR